MDDASDQAAEGWTYAIGIGSNRPWRRTLGPRSLVVAALAALDAPPLRLLAVSPIIASRPLGPSRRTYANAAALIETALEPLALLNHLQAIEARFGRRRTRRWGERTLDLDILLWSGGVLALPRLAIPHPAMPERAFVLEPLTAIAGDWPHPLLGCPIAALAHRNRTLRPIHR
jgi:2-amino-4-hydroxy-6-hydroxymethyldihydropteridine diphosphokinase